MPPNRGHCRRAQAKHLLRYRRTGNRMKQLCLQLFRLVNSYMILTAKSQLLFPALFFCAIVEQGRPEDVIDNPQNERTRAFLKKLER